MFYLFFAIYFVPSLFSFSLSHESNEETLLVLNYLFLSFFLLLLIFSSITTLSLTNNVSRNNYMRGSMSSCPKIFHSYGVFFNISLYSWLVTKSTSILAIPNCVTWKQCSKINGDRCEWNLTLPVFLIPFCL